MFVSLEYDETSFDLIHLSEYDINNLSFSFSYYFHLSKRQKKISNFPWIIKSAILFLHQIFSISISSAMGLTKEPDFSPKKLLYSSYTDFLRVNPQ